jgi:hypothetical protein
MKTAVCSILLLLTVSAAPVAAQYKTKAEIDFMIAENKYELCKYPEAISLFQRLRLITDDQNKIDSANVRIADSLYVLGYKDVALRMYKNVFMDKRYSMIKTIAFWKWRTMYQLRYFGVDPTSKIPNKFYNKYRIRLHNRLKRYSQEHPLAVSPLSQLGFLREMPNLSYDESKGASVLTDFRVLYPEFRIKRR